MEIEYQGVKKTIGELTLEQAQDLIFDLLNEKQDMHEVIQKMYFYGKMDSIIEDDIAKKTEEPASEACECYDCAHIGHKKCGCCQ